MAKKKKAKKKVAKKKTKKIPIMPKKKKKEYVRLVHKGKRFLFTKKEYNRAWLRAKKRSGLN